MYLVIYTLFSCGSNISYSVFHLVLFWPSLQQNAVYWGFQIIIVQTVVYKLTQFTSGSGLPSRSTSQLQYMVQQVIFVRIHLIAALSSLHRTSAYTAHTKRDVLKHHLPYNLATWDLLAFELICCLLFHGAPRQQITVTSLKSTAALSEHK